MTEFLRPYLGYLFLGLFCMIVAAGCTALLAKQMKPVIDDIFIGRNADMLLVVAVQVFFIFLCKGLVSYGEVVSMTYVGENIVVDMRKRLIRHILRADLSFFHNTPSGELISRFVTDVNMLHRVVSRTLTSIVKDGLTVIFLLAVMFYEDWLLASIAFAVFPIAFFPIVYIGKRIRKSSGSIQSRMAGFTVQLSQIFQGARLIKSYNMEDHENQRASALADKICKLVMKATRTRSAGHPIMEILGGIAIVTVIYYGGYQVINGTATSGAFFTFITALLLAYEPMKHLANLNSELQEKLAAATRVFAVLSVKPKIVNKARAQDLRVTNASIRFQDVHFSYDKGSKTIKGINLLIPAGKTVALVGASGGGKSTIMNLIPRFYDINHGSILIDGQDIRDVTLESMRANIALVSQEIILFDDTVRNNIAYGRIGATEEEIIAIAKGAAAHEFIMDLPDGYDTWIGEQGIRLSGGQRQRLAIARAMLKDAPILLLDEATSALDTKSERQVQKALKTLTKGRTTLIIAHRLSTIIDADIICLVENGEIIDLGTHAELLVKSPKYAKLCQAQFTSNPTNKKPDVVPIEAMGAG